MTYKSAEDKREACRRWRASNPIGSLLKNARDRTRMFGLEFSLTAADFEDVPTHCPVLGLELVYPGAGKGRSDNSASLDRLDSSKGYVKGNVAIISWRANRLKSDATLAELQALVQFMEKANGRPVQS